MEITNKIKGEINDFIERIRKTAVELDNGKLEYTNENELEGVEIVSQDLFLEKVKSIDKIDGIETALYYDSTSQYHLVSTCNLLTVFESADEALEFWKIIYFILKPKICEDIFVKGGESNEN